MPSLTPVPNGQHTLTPYLKIRGVKKALEFYKKAFGAEEAYHLDGPGGTIMHAEMRLGDSKIMMTDENPQWNCMSPQAVGNTTVTIHMYVPDVDAVFAQAVAAGAKADMPPQDMFWGDRFGKVTDPFGHEWTIATPKEKLSPQQMAERAKVAFEQMAQQQPPKH